MLNYNCAYISNLIVEFDYTAFNLIVMSVFNVLRLSPKGAVFLM